MRKSFLFAAAAAIVFTLNLHGVAQAPAAPAPTAAAAPGPASDDTCPAPGERRFPPPGVAQQGGPANRPQGGPGNGAQGGPGGPGGGQGGPEARTFKKRLLIWADNRNGLAQHDIGHAEAVIEEMGYTSGLWDTYIRTDSNIIAKRPKMTTGQPASGGPSLCNVDAIFFLGHREVDIDASQKADLLWFVHDQGKGFVLAHTGVGAFDSWPEFGEMIGARWDDHPWGTTEAHLIVNDPKFPGMVFKTGDDFKDEFYALKEFHADQIHVVLSLDTTGLDMTRNGVHPGSSLALAYTKMYGKGRIFYSTFAHAPATWDDQRVRSMYMGAIMWALGLTDADVTPNPGTGAVIPATAGPKQ